MLEIITPRLVEITPSSFTEVCESYSLEIKEAAFFLSFGFHYNKRLFLDIDERVYLFKEKQK